jgi:hypothetical protein
MKFRSLLLSAATVAALSAPVTAQAEGVVIASDPQTVMDFFFDLGVPAKLTVDGVGDPLIEFRVNANEMQLYFYDCENNADCLAVQFFSGYQVDDSVSLSDMNAWNADRRFARGYLTDDGAARIEMDVATSYHGIATEDFMDLYELWLESVDVFEARIGW